VSRLPKTAGTTNLRQNSGRPVFAIAEIVVQACERYLQGAARDAHEKVVYVAGVKRPDVWIATTVIRPKARTTRGSFATSSAANADVVAFLSDVGLSILGQVHTHPGPFVEHSGGDDEGAFMPTENYLSIVVPNYGRQGMLPIERCGVHRYESGTFRRMFGEELTVTVCIVPLAKDFAR
jgi:proteasome lid subunit RPN8/RPN11